MSSSSTTQRRADPTFQADEATGAAIDAICDRLDGMPLAMRLAAARLRAFSVEQLLEMLSDRFHLPDRRDPHRTAAPAHARSLGRVEPCAPCRGRTILLRRLSVFAGSLPPWTAARTVAADDVLPAHHVLDLLAHLVEKSLLAHDEADRSSSECSRPSATTPRAKLLDAGEGEECRSPAPPLVPRSNPRRTGRVAHRRRLPQGDRSGRGQPAGTRPPMGRRAGRSHAAPGPRRGGAPVLGRQPPSGRRRSVVQSPPRTAASI